MKQFVPLMRKSGCHLLAAHHNNKVDGEDGRALLGSQALFGGVDTLILMNRRKDGRTMRTFQRYGTELEDTYLLLDEDTGVVTFGNHMVSERTDRIKEEMLDALGGEELTTSEWDNRVEGRQELKIKARGELKKSGIVTREKQG